MKWRASVTISVIAFFTLALSGCSVLEDLGDLASDAIDMGQDIISEAFDSDSPSQVSQSPAPTPGQAPNNNKGAEPTNSSHSQRSAATLAGTAGTASSAGQAARSLKSQRYVCVDPATKITVSTLELPAGWRCASTVLHPAGAHSFWRYALVNTRNGGVAVINSSISHFALGSYKKQKLFAEPKSLASLLGDDLQRAYSTVQAFKITSCSLQSSTEPAVLQLVDMFQKQSGLKFVPLALDARYSFTGNGRVQKGGGHVEIIANDLNMAGLQASSLMFVSSWCCACAPNEFADHQKVIRQIIASDTVTPEWQRYLEQENMQLSAQVQRNATRLQNTLDETSSLISSSYAERSASQDRLSQGWSEAILGTESVADPFDSDHQIEVSAYNDHAWVNASGDVINTDSSLYNPNTDQALNANEWRQLK